MQTCPEGPEASRTLSVASVWPRGPGRACAPALSTRHGGPPPSGKPAAQALARPAPGLPALLPRPPPAHVHVLIARATSHAAPPWAALMGGIWPQSQQSHGGLYPADPCPFPVTEGALLGGGGGGSHSEGLGAQDAGRRAKGARACLRGRSAPGYKRLDSSSQGRAEGTAPPPTHHGEPSGGGVCPGRRQAGGQSEMGPTGAGRSPSGHRLLRTCRPKDAQGDSLPEQRLADGSSPAPKWPRALRDLTGLVTGSPGFASVPLDSRLPRE